MHVVVQVKFFVIFFRKLHLRALRNVHEYEYLADLKDFKEARLD